ncbi:MAG TPA: AI-2E family transporter [Pseudomonadales bacterium]|nr:AI-2E family transporter [Pseudomonadales bacterium]
MDAKDDAPAEENGGGDRFPIVVRSVALAVVAGCASLWLLDWAAEVFIPVLLGLMFSYALSPIVDRLQAWHIPRVIGAAVLLVSIIGGTVAAMYSMEDDANALIESLPDTAQKIRQALRPQTHTPDSAIANMQAAATQIEQAAADTAAPKPPSGGVTRVQIEQPRFDIQEHLWSGTLGLVALLGQATVVLFVTFFLLASGDTFRRKMASIAGPTFRKKRITVEALDEITDQIKRYLLVQLLLSVLVGFATWAAFLWIGLAHAGVWGVMSGVLNLVPYFGAIAVTGGSALVGFVQFGEFQTALIVAGASLVIHSIVGYVLTPWLTGRASSMNPVVVFVGVLAWGWLWGIWGLLLGMPIMLAIKAVCDRVEELKPIGELLGE